MKYMLILRGDDSKETPTDQLSPREIQEMIDVWDAYSKELADAGALLGGEGLHPSASATTVEHGPDGERFVTDGPFAETKEQVGGFYLIDVSDLDHALEWAKKVPMGGRGFVEVRSVLDFTDQG